MLVIAFIILALTCPFQAEFVVQHNSLVGPFTAESGNLAHWDLTGSAQPGDGYIRLTTDERNKQGAIWNNLPNLSNNFEIQVHFRIHGRGVYLNGEGMAIWYVRKDDMLKHGPVFGSKDFFSGFGVFIDTFANQVEPHKHLHPYISAMVNNGSLHYEHDEDGTFTQIGGCYSPVRNSQLPIKIAVSYINNNIAVYVDSEGLNQWNMCFTAEGIFLPTGYYFGVSASTGDHSDNHDVISITSLNLDPENMLWIDNSAIIPEAKNVQIPKKYHKKLEEEELKNIKKREMKEEEDEEESEEKEEEEEEIEMEGDNTEEIAPPSTSLLRKLVYITGAVIIILISISTFRKYLERRRERMHKRLF